MSGYGPRHPGRPGPGFILGLGAIAGLMACGDPTPVADRASEARAADGRFIRWVEHRIDDSARAGGPRLRGADGLELADFDGDGREDIVAVHEDSDHLRLSFATDDPDRWHGITLAEGADVAGAEDTAVGDLDGDGDLDLLVACEGGLLVYLENPGGPAAREPDAWRRAVPKGVTGRGSWIRVDLAELDERPGLEVVATNKSIPMPSGRGSMDVPKTPVSWFAIEGDPLDPSVWREHPLGEWRVPVNGRVVDLDGDGDRDVVIGSRGEARLVLAEQVASRPLRFVLRPITPNRTSWLHREGLPKMFSGFALAFRDLDRDGRLDLVTSETPWSLVWLAQPDRPDEPWARHPIGAFFPDSPTAITLVDIDGDGREDLFTGGYSDDPRETEIADPGPFHRAGGLAWLAQPADPTDPWIRHDVSRRTRAMYDAFVARDLNGDGLVDLVGTRGNSGALDGVIWLEQVRTAEAGPVFTSAWPRARDSRQRPMPPAWLRALGDRLLL